MTLIKAREQKHGPLNDGEIVDFHTGHVDRHFKPQANDAEAWLAAFRGEVEGWSILGHAIVLYSP